MIRVTVPDANSGQNRINSTQRACLMSDNVENCNARLAKFVRRIMKEKDPVEFDELCSVLWLVLNEREGLGGVEGSVDGASTTARVIPSRIPTLGSRFVMTQEGMHHQYRVTAWWTSGCTGLAKSDTAPNAIHFTAPAQFGGVEGRWTPEELLLAATAGCFTTTLRSIASSAKFDYADLEVEASATLRKMDSGYNFSEIVIRPTLRITGESERELALDLLKKAHRLCLVSRAFAIPIRFEPQLEVAAALASVQ